MKKHFTKLLTLCLLMSTLMVVTSCGEKGNSNSANSANSTNSSQPHKTYDNETTPLVFATTDLDGVFNPFYYTTGTDGTIVGMTQLSMLSTTPQADVAYGEDEPALVLDYEQKYDKGTDKTTYTFVLKNPSYGARFSNGTYVTLRDVLFNIYEYLDPQYMGSSTMYSTDIVGLKEYRTQEDSEAGQEAFENKFRQEADERVNTLINVIDEIKRDNKNIYTSEEYIAELTKKQATYSGNASMKYANKFVDDFNTVSKEFHKELENDYKSNKDTYDDVFYPTEEQKAANLEICGSKERYELFCNIQTFFSAEGLIAIDLDKDRNDPKRIDYQGFSMAELKEMFSESAKDDEIVAEAVNIVYEANFPDNFAEIANYWQTATTIRDQFVSEAKEKYFSENTDRRYKDISGIKVITSDTKVNDTTYPYALYDSNGDKIEGSDNGYEMFSITINGVDPKAIWNFGFSVAPMYYYSNEEQIKKFNYGLKTDDPCFGVEYGKRSFQEETIKGGTKVGLPMGAGAYKAATRDDGQQLTEDNFFDSNVVYFERNDYFLMGKPKIKKIRYQVTSTNQMLNALTTGLVQYCEPSAKKEIIDELNVLSSQGYDYSSPRTLGYGYIGINAKDVPDHYARIALMTTFNAQYSKDYYGGEAEILYRPMSSESWAYPKGATAYYPYDPTGESAKDYLRSAGYSQNQKGMMVDQKTGKQFKLTFTIAGDDPDHPAAQVFYQSEKILESIGCDITVKTDVDALTKLNTGDLACWAAAWSTTIDPDMYQTYHIDSTATSTLNWGYSAIKNDTAGTKYKYEKDLIAELSQRIEDGRKTLDRELRKTIYADCLDMVMRLAVEFPLYQRNDLFAYNSAIIDTSTMTPKNEVTAYNGPINKIWELSLITK